MPSRVGLIRQIATKYGLDPEAVLAIASHEGSSALMGGNSIGDHGTSFGPFQLHAGGALPKGKGNNWANSPAGIDYAIREMAPYARGLQGQDAVQAISQGFERPADVTGEVRDAMAHYGKITGNGVGPVTYPPTSDGKGGLGPIRPPAQQDSQQAFRSMVAASLLQGGGSINSDDLLALAMARRQFGAAQQTFGAQPTSRPLVGPGMKGGLHLPVEGNIGSENPNFLSAVTAAAKARGAVKIIATSGERSPQHNAAIGGASQSNHLPDAHGFGHALDGYAVMSDGSRIPLGQFLLPVAGQFGLRSGATFSWNGKPDVVHVDDGFNVKS
jgi:hypothetical protein